MKIDRQLIFGRVAVSGMIMLLLIGSVLGYTTIGTDINVEGILYTDTITEHNVGGVTIEGINCDSNALDMSGALTVNTVNEHSAGGVTIEGINCDSNALDMSGALTVDTINEHGANGVTIEGVKLNATSIDCGHLIYNTNRIENNDQASDGAGILFNYMGIGTSWYRDFYIYDGKGAQVVFIDGSIKETDFYGTIKTNTINAHSAGTAVVIKELSIGDGSQLSISGGAVTVTQGYHRVDGETSPDDLTVINGGSVGQLLVLRYWTTQVTVKDTGDLKLEGDFTMDTVHDTITLINTGGTEWCEVSRANNS